MSLDDPAYDPERHLGLLHRNTLARSLLRRARRRADTTGLARSFQAVSRLGAGFSQHDTSRDAAIPRLLADAARRVREHAARQAGLEP